MDEYGLVPGSCPVDPAVHESPTFIYHSSTMTLFLTASSVHVHYFHVSSESLFTLLICWMQVFVCFFVFLDDLFENKTATVILIQGSGEVRFGFRLSSLVSTIFSDCHSIVISLSAFVLLS